MDEAKALCSKFDNIFENTKQKSVACQVCTLKLLLSGVLVLQEVAKDTGI